jgi:peptide/nickel transport system permease protein
MRFIARRLIFYLIAAWVAATANFFIPRALPGNAVEDAIARFPHLTPAALNVFKVEFGLGHSGGLLHQYVTYLGNIIHGRFGVDVVQYPASVVSVLRSTLPWTLVLVGSATLISFALGTLLGILAAWRRGGWLDRALPVLTFLQAVPYFFLALLAVYAFAIDIHLFPAQQGYSEGLVPGWSWAFISSAFVHALLPALTIIVASIAGWMLQMRNVMITTVGEDYVLAGHAKGLSTQRVMLNYAARNAILPSISSFALSLGYVVSGALLTEIVFSYPGIGLTLYNAVQSHDYPLMQAAFLIIALVILVANLLSDVVYVIIDPRARTTGAR